MNILKITIAIALFVTSVNFQEQIISTNNGMEVSWSISVTHNQALAKQLQEAAQDKLEAYY